MSYNGVLETKEVKTLQLEPHIDKVFSSDSVGIYPVDGCPANCGHVGGRPTSIDVQRVKLKPKFKSPFILDNWLIEDNLNIVVGGVSIANYVGLKRALLTSEVCNKLLECLV